MFSDPIALSQIGWGYGCTNNKCYGQEDRSVVWMTAVENADVFVDYNNIGRDYVTYQVNALQSVKITDTGDQDMVRFPPWRIPY